MEDSIKSQARRKYLSEFKANNSVDELFDMDAKRIGTKLVSIMKKEDLTHEQAYASLQYAYNLIRYESNFLKLK